jgi:hypothetical protein
MDNMSKRKTNTQHFADADFAFRFSPVGKNPERDCFVPERLSLIVRP